MFPGEPPRAPDEGVPVPWVPDTLAPGLSDLELVADVWASDARAARYAAQRAEAITALARRRSIERDRDFGPLGGPGLDNRLRRSEVLALVSETFVTELAMIRGCTEAEAESLAVESILLTTVLTGTWDALYAGVISERKMRVLVDLLATAKPSVIAEVERLVLPHAGRLTVPQLRGRVRRALARLDAAALDKRRKEAAKRADVVTRPTGDGMSQLVADLPVHVAAACADAIDQYAQLLRADGDQRPIGVIRAAVAADLILRPWDTSRPPVTAQLTIHAPLRSLHDPDGDGDGATQPAAEVAGEIVTAAQCREILRELDMLGVGAAPAGGCVRVAVGNPLDGRLLAVATHSQLSRAAGHRRRRSRGKGGATTSAGRTAPGDRREPGTGLGPPAPTTAYRPSAAQRRFLHVRDRHCRMPGCRRRAGRCDIDHGVAHADGGPTDCWNLCCLCRRHHRIKTFARGWRFELLADGRLVVRTPSGVSRTTRPPGWCYEAEPDPPWLEEAAPPDPLLR
ncbi:HNH endonuclease [Blastococcus sp. SYSU DS0753]